MEKCRAKTEIIKVSSDQSAKPAEITGKAADGGCSLMEMRQILPFWHTGVRHWLSCVPGCFLLLPASPVTSHRRSEGIPVAGQKWQAFQHNWSALCTWPEEINTNAHACVHVHPQTCKARLLERESVASSEAVCRLIHQESLPATVITAEHPRKLNWCDSLHPLQFSLTSPFLHCLKELMSRFLLNTHPTPSLGHPAESGDHTPTHVQASSPPPAAVLVFVFLQQTHCTKHVVSPLLGND